MMIDPTTKLWIRNRSDELAADNGCVFDVMRGSHAVWWIERFCRLYEGATGPLLLNGCHECANYDLEDATEGTEWDEWTQSIFETRAASFAECVKKGHHIDWQYDCTMRVFGWTRNSDRLKRWIRRFRESCIFVAKKNKKSPTLAAWATYMLIGDGEQGQKVYLAAKDGTQARDIAGAHVVKMIEKSEELGSECLINKNLFRVTHVSSDSWLQPLSSANETTQKSKEGLNGSVFKDELHVVDRKLNNRISRAGISRDEPLDAEFSTAGNDVDSYGYERFEFAKKVQTGEAVNQGLFAAVFAAPPQLSDAELDSDPLKYGYIANPAMGHTVDPDEFLHDYEQSKSSPASLAVFKMYRLNIWQGSSSPWLPMDKYDEGCQAFDYEAMFGQRCWASLDLSTVSDFASLCLAFPESFDGAYRFLWWFWLPDETARQVQHLIPIRNWERDPRCRLILTPGARIHFGAIRSKFRELHRQYEIQSLAYDDWNAEQTTQEISEGVTNHEGKMIEPPTGVPRVNFSQNLKTMNEPTKQFEAAVKDASVFHTGDPIARWMMQNATVNPDMNNNYRPIKSPDRTKKIDGVITAIMARAIAESGSVSTWCEEPGSLAL